MGEKDKKWQKEDIQMEKEIDPLCNARKLTDGVMGLELWQTLLFESVSEYVSPMARVDSRT